MIFLPRRLLGVALLGWAPAGAALAATLVAGPMVGYSTMREVAVWVQTDAEARVQLRYRPAGSTAEYSTSHEVQTFAHSFHTAHLIAASVEPGTRYEYQVLIDGQVQPREYALEFSTQPLWQWRGDPPPFTFALGSCAYVNETRYDRPGTPYGSDYRIFGEILKRQPDFMLWMGDNVYLREADWNSRTGIYRRYGHSRALPELQPLLGSVHHYATWDDHDYGPNDSDRSYWLKHVTAEAFRDFWANPNYGAAGSAVAGTFHWHDVQFLLLDNRWFRSPNERSTGARQLFGPAQVRWLIDSLSFSQATFKFVVSAGEFLYDDPQGEAAIHVAPEERQRIIDAITAERIPGVIFLTGDVHHSRLVKLERDGAYPLYDWTVSSLTAGSSAPDNPEGTNIVAGSLFLEHNFGLIEVSGPRADRVARLKIVDADGNERWSHELRARELCHPAPCDTGH